jgi:hypothetical protein
MMARFLVVLALALTVTGGAAAEDTRKAINLPAEMRDDFLEHMRNHMDSLDDIMSQLAGADFKGAAKVAREQLVPGSDKGVRTLSANRVSRDWVRHASRRCCFRRGS